MMQRLIVKIKRTLNEKGKYFDVFNTLNDVRKKKKKINILKYPPLLFKISTPKHLPKILIFEEKNFHFK